MGQKVACGCGHDRTEFAFPGYEARVSGIIAEESGGFQTSKIDRDKDDLIVLSFNRRPLGLVFTSAEDGTQAYVTRTAPNQNPMVKNPRLSFSKLLRINDEDVEEETIDKITNKILCALTLPPLKLTFCAASGLQSHEVPDTAPKPELTTIPTRRFKQKKEFVYIP